MLAVLLASEGVEGGRRVGDALKELGGEFGWGPMGGMVRKEFGWGWWGQSLNTVRLSVRLRIWTAVCAGQTD